MLSQIDTFRRNASPIEQPVFELRFGKHLPPYVIVMQRGTGFCFPPNSGYWLAAAIMPLLIPAFSRKQSFAYAASIR
jgi:hypothetical protein